MSTTPDTTTRHDYTDEEIKQARDTAMGEPSFKAGIGFLRSFLAALPRRESPALAEARQERPVGFNSALETWGTAEPTPPVSDKEIVNIQTEVSNNLFSAVLPEPAAQVPLGPDDVPPGSVFTFGAAALWITPLCVFADGVGFPETEPNKPLIQRYSFELLHEAARINTSLPDTGRWDKDAWRPCSKPAE